MKNIKEYKDCKRTTYKHRSRLLGETERKLSEEVSVALALILLTDLGVSNYLSEATEILNLAP